MHLQPTIGPSVLTPQSPGLQFIRSQESPHASVIVQHVSFSLHLHGFIRLITSGHISFGLACSWHSKESFGMQLPVMTLLIYPLMQTQPMFAMIFIMRQSLELF